MHALSTDITALDPIHDNRHRLGGSELARESLVYMIELPEQQIGGFLYTWVNGKGLAGAAICLFGDGVANSPLIEKCDGIPVADDMDFHNWQVNGLRVQLGKPLQTVSVFYQSDNIDIEYHFDAIHPAYSYASHKDGCPQWIANDRFEQQGMVSGHVRFADKTFTLNGFGQRDHSWGTREWGINQHWKWVHAQAGDHLGVHFWQLDAMGDRALRGYVHKDGHVAAITEVDVKAQYDQTMQQKSLQIDVRDSAGRHTVISAEAYAVFPFAVDPTITLFESPLTLSIDGESGYGWCEVLWPNSLIDYQKAKICGQ